MASKYGERHGRNVPLGLAMSRKVAAGLDRCLKDQEWNVKYWQERWCAERIDALRQEWN